MRRQIRRWMMAVAVLKLMAGGVAQADLALEFRGGTPGGVGGYSLGWSFTTNQAITVTALDDLVSSIPSSGSADVRLYDGAGIVLRTATISTSDPVEGTGPAQFYSHAIAPVALAAGTTYYIAADFPNPGADFGSSGRSARRA